MVRAVGDGVRVAVERCRRQNPKVKKKNMRSSEAERWPRAAYGAGGAAEWLKEWYRGVLRRAKWQSS